MAHARQPPSSRPSQQVYTSPGGLKVVTYVGDITTITDADAIVTGEGERFENKSFITKALLQISPMEFAQKRHELIEKHKQFHRWTIYTSELMPPSQFKFVFHAVMKNDSKNWTKKMKKMYKKLFKKADKYHVEALVLPLLGSGRANVSVRDTVQAVIESITKIHDPKYLRKIYLVTLDKDKADQMATQCQYNFHADNLKPKKFLVEKIFLGFAGSRTTDEDTLSYGNAPVDRLIEENISREGSRKSNTFPKKSTPQKRSDKGGFMRNQGKGRPQISGDTFYQTSHSLVREGEHDWQGSSMYSKSHDNPPLHETGRNNSSGDGSKSWQSKTYLRRGAPQERIEEGRSMREYHRMEHHPRGDAMPSRRQRKSESSRQKSEADSHVDDDHLRYDTRGKQFKGHQAETYKTVHTIQTQNHETLPVGLVAVECNERSLNVEMEPGRRASQRDTERNEYHQRQRNGNRPTTTEHSKDKGENDHQIEKDTESKAVNVLNLSVSRNCPICISPITGPKWLDKCGHVFCRKCIGDSFQHFKPVCPSCNMVYGVLTGNQPDGNMDVGFSGDHLPGYKGHGTITKDKGEYKRPATAVECHERSIDVEMEPGRRATEKVQEGESDVGVEETQPKQEQNREGHADGDTVSKKIDTPAELAFPPSWTRMTSYCELFKVSSGCQEYQDVGHHFLSSIGRDQRKTILEITRVQSKTLWQLYCLKKQEIDRRDPDVQNERVLWHGTTKESVPPICKNGFNSRFSGKNAARYGDGVYFAPNSNYAAEDTYSVPDDNGHKCVFQARVLTGTYTKGERGMRVPPWRNEEQHLTYDSVVDNVDNPHLYVIFHDAQAYPEYLITFK